MYKLSFLLFAISLFGGMIEQEPVYIGKISFTEAFWKTPGQQISYRTSVGRHTSKGEAVVLYFFEACMT